jgi:hypothetical protein
MISDEKGILELLSILNSLLDKPEIGIPLADHILLSLLNALEVYRAVCAI